MGEDNKQTQILEAGPEGKRIRERSRKTYMDGKEEIARNMGRERLKWKRLKMIGETGGDAWRQSDA